MQIRPINSYTKQNNAHFKGYDARLLQAVVVSRYVQTNEIQYLNILHSILKNDGVDLLRATQNGLIKKSDYKARYPQPSKIITYGRETSDTLGNSTDTMLDIPKAQAPIPGLNSWAQDIAAITPEKRLLIAEQRGTPKTVFYSARANHLALPARKILTKHSIEYGNMFFVKQGGMNIYYWEGIAIFR